MLRGPCGSWVKWFVSFYSFGIPQQTFLDTAAVTGLVRRKGMVALLKGFHTMAIYACYWSDLQGQ